MSSSASPCEEGRRPTAITIIIVPEAHATLTRHDGGSTITTDMFSLAIFSARKHFTATISPAVVIVHTRRERRKKVSFTLSLHSFFTFGSVPVLRLRPLCTVPNPPLPIIFPICCKQQKQQYINVSKIKIKNEIIN
jgi:hypothetical protein